MPTRNVVLTDHHQDMIDRLVKSGRYQNASEVLREGLRLVEQREEVEAAKLKALREAAAIGFADLDEGRFSDVSGSDLENHIERLGVQAMAQVRRSGSDR
ncbi:type II toxin-antitoxin system ParD family antitoxin [Rhizobium oryzicola]|uniref:Type II toxin-antitoxin system ParD family antitoxin n=1 Tax=Rhizobium oryzicola TaxID=1232668 RepID=A0ABT8T0M5_9HYPH|nr:type II toxin-antitoxin system ParD family antitoxin [Rhizobium oryzicola]MDO1584309.1 type II toxin-antitoxin system ParD family antitoxin [Rhizobium oryzicola]